MKIYILPLLTVLGVLFSQGTTVSEWDFITVDYAQNPGLVKQGYFFKDAGSQLNEPGHWGIEYKLMFTDPDSVFKAIMVIISTIGTETGHPGETETHQVLCIPRSDSNPEIMKRYSDQMQSLDYNTAVLFSYLFGIAGSEFIENSYKWMELLESVEDDLAIVNAMEAKKSIHKILKASKSYQTEIGIFPQSISVLERNGYLIIPDVVKSRWEFFLSNSFIAAKSLIQNDRGEFITVEYTYDTGKFEVHRISEGNK